MGLGSVIDCCTCRMRVEADKAQTVISQRSGWGWGCVSLGQHAMALWSTPSLGLHMHMLDRLILAFQAKKLATEQEQRAIRERHVRSSDYLSY